MTLKTAREQVDKNYDAFVAMLPSILAMHQNKYALMKDGEAVGFYSTLEDAYMRRTNFSRTNHFQFRRSRISPSTLGSFHMPLVAGN